MVQTSKQTYTGCLNKFLDEILLIFNYRFDIFFFDSNFDSCHLSSWNLQEIALTL